MSTSNLTKKPEKSLSDNAYLVYLATLSTSSRRIARDSLIKLSDILTSGRNNNPEEIDWGSLEYQHAVMVRAWLEKAGYAPATINRELSFLRSVCKQAWLLGQSNSESYHRLAAVTGVRDERLPAGRKLEIGEIKALMDTCKADQNQHKGVRDAAMLGIMYICGLRRDELVNLNWADYSEGSGELRIKHGKGNKERKTFVGGAEKPLKDWLSFRTEAIIHSKARDDEFQPMPGNGPLFLPVRRGGRIEWRRLSAQSVYNMTKDRAKQAGIQQFSPHDLRHTFVSLMLEEIDAITVARMAGHSSVDTTMRYDKRGDKKMEQASHSLFLPY